MPEEHSINQPLADPGYVLHAIKVLRGELPATPANEEMIRALDAVEQAVVPEVRTAALSRALEVMGRYPAVQGLFGEILSQSAFEGLATFREYQAPAGTPVALPAGTRMVCPVDPEHFEDYLRTAGEQLTCPIHDVSLVPVGATAA